jgi:hypothetical protein
MRGMTGTRLPVIFVSLFRRDLITAMFQFAHDQYSMYGKLRKIFQSQHPICDPDKICIAIYYNIVQQ